jgi:putative endonuclease
MCNHNYYVYIATNAGKTVLYIGVTNDVRTRIDQHEENKGSNRSFTGKYYCHYLVYYEHFISINEAIAREKEIKKWRREKKIALIESVNPLWRFLNDEV